MAEPMPAPTKTNLIKEKRNLQLALQGYDLLEKKREILVIELMKRMDALELLEQEIAKMTDDAYAALRKMLLSVGRERALSISSLPVRDITLSASYINVSGMHLPTLDVRASAPVLHYSFMNSFAVCDETVIEFTELLDKLSTAAGMRSIVWRWTRW
jgi:V/A-type H+-transporting ATPase subunit D